MHKFVVGDYMKDVTKELLSLAELVKELKSREFDKKFPLSYQAGWKVFEERVKQLESEIETFRKENKDEI